jgi:hypothetical protein
LAIEPAAIERYLQSTGWSAEEVSTKRASVWIKPGEGKRHFEVLVPRRASFTDYPVRLFELASVLEQAEGRPREEVLRDLRSASGAIVTLRANADAPDEASIRLFDGLAIASAGLRMIAAAAQSVASQIASSTAAQVHLANAFIGEVRLAPAEAGSYLVPLVLPTDLEDHTFHLGQATLLDQDRSMMSGNRVKEQLEEILDQVKLRAAVSAAVGERSREWGASETATWNALASLAYAEHLTVLSIEFDPAPDLERAKTRHVFVFDHASLRRISEMSPFETEEHVGHRLEEPRVIAQPEEIRRQGVELMGKVRRLERPAVTLATELDGRTRTVRVVLPTEDIYERAIEAHRRRATVVCAGVLVQRRQSVRLEDVYLFDLVD